MTLLSEIYDVTLKRGNRGAAKAGWIRPTIGECFKSNFDFVYKPSASTYFGNKSDGDLITTSNVSFSSTIDGDTVYKNFNNLVINSGHTVTVANRCKGMVIYCYKDCTINGTLSMTARGCKGAGENFAPNGLDAVETETGIIDLTIPAVGGAVTGIPHARGYSSYYDSEVTGFTGNSTTNGACGGGGAGGASSDASGTNAYGGAGGAGTSWCGGAGGGGGATDAGQVEGCAGSSFGGAGGAGVCWQAKSGGGAGNPGGPVRYPNCAGSIIFSDFNGGTGAGGLLILVVKGNLIINGSVVSKGSNGSGAYSSDSATAGGGGSGGGSITLLHYGDLTNNGTISVAGGLGGTEYAMAPGGNGGSGSLRIHKVL